MNSITVAITTNGKRTQKLHNCLDSLQNGTRKPDEVFVIQQSEKKLEMPPWVKTWNVGKMNVSSTKNMAIKRCRTKIIVFTDDDCLVDRHWIERISSSFDDSKICAVFGKSIPYIKTKNKGSTCPSYMLRNIKEVSDSFTLHKTHFGIGNNMAFRKEVLTNIGGFFEWLGPRTFASAAEDIELIFRLFMRHDALLYNPKVITYHDRWLTDKENRIQYRKYYRGILAAYTYHMCHVNSWGHKVVISYWKSKIKCMFRETSKILNHPAILKNIYYDLFDIGNYILGMLIGAYHALISGYDNKQSLYN
jgi:GT2 family glycosyltransferase